jgi:hypothetical protein
MLSPDSISNSGVIAVESSGTSLQGESGLRVYMDSETGEVSDGVDPNAVVEIDPDMANALSHDPEGLTTRRNADGSETLDLEGRFHDASVVRMDENGKLIICTENVANLEKALTDTTPIAAEVK